MVADSRKVPVQIFVVPNLDNPCAIDHYHLLCDIEVSNQIKQLGVSLEALRVQVEHIWVGDLGDVAESERDSFKEQVPFIVFGAEL